MNHLHKIQSQGTTQKWNKQRPKRFAQINCCATFVAPRKLANVTLSIMTISIITAVRQSLSSIMLSIVVLSIIMLNIVMLSVVILSVIF
jgi:hypothetical protein